MFSSVQQTIKSALTFLEYESKPLSMPLEEVQAKREHADAELVPFKDPEKSVPLSLTPRAISVISRTGLGSTPHLYRPGFSPCKPKDTAGSAINPMIKIINIVALLLLAILSSK